MVDWITPQTWYDEHTIEPDPRTIQPDMGMYIGDYLARCRHCNRWISGDENGAYHLTKEDLEDLEAMENGF